jgi:SAM-dependent methyltransferase
METSLYTLTKYLRNKLYKFIQISGLKKKYYRRRRDVFSKFNLYKKQGNTIALDLGSGPAPVNPFDAATIYGSDIRENVAKNVVKVDLASGQLPFDDDSFDFITAYDLLEHIPRVSLNEGKTTFPFILLMNELHRILKKDGVFFCIQPCYPFAQSFQDPTHVNIMSEDTIQKYFAEEVWAKMYGFNGKFEILDDGWMSYKYFCFMSKSH